MANEIKVCILWAGGWDEYLIDTDNVMPVSPEEIANNEARIAKGHGGEPVIENHKWLRTGFILPGYYKPHGELGENFPKDMDQMVRIVRHLRGGD